MKTKWFKSIACMGLVIVLLGAGATQPVRAAGADAMEAAVLSAGLAGVADKEEVVYANLSTAGAVREVYVVNEFDVTADGLLTDFGDYTMVANLTSTAPMEQTADAVSVEADAGKFYYQGTLASQNLPWVFTISYTLDGAPVDPADLAGNSGQLAIHITSRQNMAVDATFYDNYMLQISLTLDADKCTNISAPDATVANAGKNKMVVFTVMPGKDADATVSADVTAFEMPGMEISGMPFSTPISLPDTSDVTGEMSSLTDAIAQLNDGVDQLATGAQGLADGSTQLASGSAQMATGLSQLSASSASLVAGSNQINQALADMAAAMSGGSGIDPTQLAQLPAALSGLATGISDVNAALGSAYDALAGAIGQLSTDPVDTTALQGAVDAMADGPDKDAAQASLNQLNLQYAAAQQVKATFDSVNPTFALLLSADPATVGSLAYFSAQLSGLSSMVDTALQSLDIAGLQQLADGLVALSGQYGQFHQGLVGYTGGVDSIAAGYGQMNTGIASLAAGTQQYSDGADKLQDGSGQLNDAVADLPDEMQSEIDKLMDEYDTSDFVPVSFVSDKNTNTILVQFVFMTDAIAIPAETMDAPQQADNTTLWDRVVALFQ